MMAKGIKTPKSDASLSKRYKVSGQVFNSLGEPVAKQQVWAADVDLPGAAIYKTVARIKRRSRRMADLITSVLLQYQVKLTIFKKQL